MSALASLLNYIMGASMALTSKKINEPAQKGPTWLYNQPELHDGATQLDSSIRLLHHFLPAHRSTSAWILASFSAGNESMPLSVSIWIPRNVVAVAGPSPLSSASGTPKSADTFYPLKVQCAYTRPHRTHTR